MYAYDCRSLLLQLDQVTLLRACHGILGLYRKRAVVQYALGVATAELQLAADKSAEVPAKLVNKVAKLKAQLKDGE